MIKINTKNRLMINNIIKKTKYDNISWSHIGSDSTSSVFMTFNNIIGDKYLIIELHASLNNPVSEIIIYMENSTNNNKIQINKISSNKSKNINHLVKLVIDNIRNDDLSDEIDEIHNKIFSVYTMVR